MTTTGQAESNDSVKRLAKQGVAVMALQFGGSQLLRFASNLILARILFPEAFGTMALAQILIVALSLFSDTGVRTSIMQSSRGDAKEFLNTAWTISIFRGLLLWLLALFFAGPFSNLYGEPLLAQLLYVTSFCLVIDGINPTALYTASRHIRLGRVAIINLSIQFVDILIAVSLAYILRSVWAMAFAMVISSVLRTCSYYIFLPGDRNRLQFDRGSFLELFHFGKYIFLSTILTFVLTQSDRAVLGYYISLSLLGVYGIGLALAQMPTQLSEGIQSAVVMPLYRMRPISESKENRRALFRARRLLALATVAMLATLAVLGPFLIDILYDARYALAGPVVTVVTTSAVFSATLNSSKTLLLGVGDSRRHLFLVFVTAVFQMVLLMIGINIAGLAGAAMAPGLAILLSYPVRMRYARIYNAWDPLQDYGITGIGLVMCSAACVLHWERIQLLLP